jgi:hypothetical protein
MSSVSGPSSPEPRRVSAESTPGKITLPSSRQSSVSPPSTPLAKATEESKVSLKNAASRFFSSFMTPPSSPSPLSGRTLSFSSVSSGAGRASPVESVALSALSISRGPTPKELLHEKKFSGTQGPFSHTSFGPFAKTQEEYVNKIKGIFPSPDDKIKFNLEDLDAVTGAVATGRGSPAPALKSLDKFARQIYLDISRDASITLFGKTFDKSHFSDPSNADKCKEEIKAFINNQLKEAGVPEALSLRIINSLHQGMQTPIIGLVNLVFNKVPDKNEVLGAEVPAAAGGGSASVSEKDKKNAESIKASLMMPDEKSTEEKVLDALSGMPTDPIGEISWEKMKTAPFDKLDINVSQSGRNIRLETSLFFRSTGSAPLESDIYQAKLVIEDMSSGLSFVEIKRVA